MRIRVKHGGDRCGKGGVALLLGGAVAFLAAQAAYATEPMAPAAPPRAPVTAEAPAENASTSLYPAPVREAGKALREALARIETDPGAAESQLKALRAAQPHLVDLVLTAAARQWLEAGDTVRAETAAGEALRIGPSSGLRAPLEAARARAAAAVGAEPLARAAWNRAAKAAKSRDERAEYRFELAASHERSGEQDAAVAIFRELWIEAPTTPAAARAGLRLDDLETYAAIPRRSAKDAMRRADRLFDARRSAAALEAYELARIGPLTKRDRRHVAMRRALSLFRARDYPRAVQAFSSISGGEARFWRARALARAGRVEEAIDVFESIGNQKNARRRTWARYLAAILHEGRGRHERARQHYERVLAQGGELGRSARWRLAWQSFLDERYADARSHFTRLIRQRADPIERLRPRYWAARSLESTDPERAAAELRSIAREFPLTYYALQARRVLGEPSLEALPNRVAADPPRLLDSDLFRARVALAAGQEELARRLLQELRPRAKRIRDRLALAELYHAAGDSYPALQLVVVPYSGILAKGIDPQIRELWQAAWPRPFASLVRELSPEGLEDSVVWSVMREESGFRVEVESITGALGLLQIQPATGERLAREVGLKAFVPALLMQPEVNVRLGSFYLHTLAGEFGVLPPAIASYNAGEHAVRSWIEPDDDPQSDVWIESIPYTQTRNYVKRVLRNLTYYRALEGAGDNSRDPETGASTAPDPAPENAQKPALRAADTALDEAQRR